MLHTRLLKYAESQEIFFFQIATTCFYLYMLIKIIGMARYTLPWKVFFVAIKKPEENEM